MNDYMKKHWTSLLGALFVLTAFAYLFKYSVDQGWLTNSLKIGLGLAVGIGLVLLGAGWLARQDRKAPGEVIAGCGFALLYATFSFAGIYFGLWEPMTVFLCMLAVTAVLGFYAHLMNLRMLMNIGLLGALMAPLVMRPEGDQVFTLFLYLLVLNTAYLVVSIQKRWPELRIVAFAGTWLLYAVYYLWFDPQTGKVWSLPFRYATAAFVFYVLAFLASSWREGKKFDGANLYMGVLNAVMYGLWSVTILDGVLPFAYPLAAMGLLYVAAGYTVYRLTGKIGVPVLTKALGGLFMLLLAASRLGDGYAVKPLISVYVWTAVAVLLLAASRRTGQELLKLGSVIVWACIGCYWYVVTWDTPRGEWFGVFIPFLNWGALSWELLALLGFYYSLRVRFESIKAETNERLSRIFAVLSHLIVGGLLTVQVESLFHEYGLTRKVDLDLTLSAVWGTYALLLFLWGAYSRQTLFRVFGSVVLAGVALKTLLLDLAGQDTIYKIVVLLALGGISFAITFVNQRWMQRERVESNDKIR